MPEGQDEGNANANANGNAGGNAGGGQKTTYTLEEHQAELQREADRRVSEAHKKWKADLDAAVADKTKDAEAKLADLTGKASEAEARATFAEEAVKAGVQDIKAAYVVAKELGYLKDGKLNVTEFKKNHPQFFARPARLNGGAGGVTTGPGSDVNAYIRTAAGV